MPPGPPDQPANRGYENHQKGETKSSAKEQHTWRHARRNMRVHDKCRFDRTCGFQRYRRIGSTQVGDFSVPNHSIRQLEPAETSNNGPRRNTRGALLAIDVYADARGTPWNWAAHIRSISGVSCAVR